MTRWRIDFPGFLRADWAKTLFFLFLATLLSMQFFLADNGFPNASVIYLLAVALISRFTKGLLWGVFASAFSVVMVNFFFTYPYAAINFTISGYPLTFLSMLLVSILISALTRQTTRQAHQAEQREAQARQLYELSRQLLAARERNRIVSLVLSYVCQLTGRAAVFYLHNPLEDRAEQPLLAGEEAQQDILLSEAERQAAAQAFQKEESRDAGPYPLARGVYMPVVNQQHLHGVLGVLYEEEGPPSGEDLNLLQTITALLALALGCQHLADERHRMVLESEKEKMRSNLLRAVSHDLRTPLTSIYGASSAVLESRGQLDRETHDKLIQDIRQDSQWLINMVENLLSVTRISESGATVKKTEEAAEEIVAAAVGRVRASYPLQKIKVSVPQEFFMVPMDATLIQQVLINLLENAVKHAGTSQPVEVTVLNQGDHVLFTVRDHGRGLRPEAISTIFEGYQMGESVPSDSSRGMGIGLAICKSIVSAHGGRISAENHPEGGAVFAFTLPMAPA